MKRIEKLIAMLIAAVLCLTGAALAEEVNEAKGITVNTLIEDGSFVIQVPVDDGGLAWNAYDMAQDDSVVALAYADTLEDTFVARYDAVGDGDVTVGIRHFSGIACDQLMTWDLRVKDGAVQEVIGGSHTASPADEEMDPYLCGAWLEAETQFHHMTVEKNPSRGWDVEIVSPVSHGAYVFKTSIIYDCELNAFVYDKGKFWDLPLDGNADAALGEAKVAGSTGSFELEGDADHVELNWYDGQRPDDIVTFERADAGRAAIDYGASELFTQADMDEAIALIEAEFANWAGCELHSIRYAGDDASSAEYLSLLNDDTDEGEAFTECIEFLSDFHSPVEAVGAWEPDTEYTDYQWWLARSEGGAWTLMGWGY